jgi:hypothetical protein
MAWMTASECADWWRDLLNDGTNAAYEKLEKHGLGADTFIGLQITWHINCLSSAADMFIFDPLRLGAGTGMAVGDDRPGVWNGAMRVLNVVADVGRATCFLPLGKLTRLGKVAAIEEGAAARVVPRQGATQAGAAGRPGAVQAGMPAHGEPPSIQPSNEGLQQSSEILERIFQVAPDSAPGHNICGWDALTRALRDSKRWYIRIEDIARLAGVRSLPFSTQTARAMEQLTMRSIRDYARVLTRLNIPAREVPLVNSLSRLAARTRRAMGWGADEVAETVEHALRSQSGPGVMLFLVEWLPPGARNWVGHVLYGKIDDAGRFLIVDRSGAMVRTLAGLEAVQPGISNARFMEPVLANGDTAGMLFIEQATTVESRRAMSLALRQTADNPMVNGVSSGLLGPLALPIKLHLHIPATPNIPRPPVR